MILNKGYKNFNKQQVGTTNREGFEQYVNVLSNNGWIKIDHNETAYYNFLRVGDKIRLIDDDNIWKYFWLKKADSISVTMFGEDEVNGTIRELYFNRDEYAEDFPEPIGKTLLVYDDTATEVTVDGELNLQMFGIFFRSWGTYTGTLSTASNFLYIQLPLYVISDDEEFFRDPHLYLKQGGGSSYEHGFYYSYVPATALTRYIKVKRDGGNLGVGDFEINLNYEGYGYDFTNLQYFF